MPTMMKRCGIAARALTLCGGLLAAGAPVAAQRASTFVGGDILIAQPQGEFKDYVDAAFGVGGHLIHQLDSRGLVSFRAELGYLNYGSTTNRQPLGGGALGLIMVDVTTTNNIMFGGVGLQLLSPVGVIRPYLTGTVGFSYFFTHSSVAGVNNPDEFASSENFSDGGFTTLLGGGFYIPLRGGVAPISLDLAAQFQRNADIQYLTKEGIRITDTNAPPTLSPVRSAADFISFRLGVSVGLPRKNNRE